MISFSVAMFILTFELTRKSLLNNLPYFAWSIKVVSDNSNLSQYKNNNLIWKSKIYNIFLNLIGEI